MEKFALLEKIKEVYERGENIIQYLKSIDSSTANALDDILISYDFQAGSYVKALAKNPVQKRNYCSSLAAVVNTLGDFESIMEAGVGEATTLGTFLKSLNKTPAKVLGFDISWSRLKFAKGLLRDFHFSHTQLFVGNLFNIPLLDNSVELVYTSHSIEPNGGNEEAALRELYRITKKYLILLEPAYEFASDEAKARMKHHGYVTELFPTARKMGLKILDYRLFEHSSNPLNPTGIMIIEKKQPVKSNPPVLVCPITKTELNKMGESILFSKDGLLAYPVIEQIPCLLKENSILTTHLLTDYDEYKKSHAIDL